MAFAKTAMALFLIMALCKVSMAAVYKVGDSAGWTVIDTPDYKKWAASKTFHVGDIIIFEYNTQFHNVKKVKHADFQSCNASAAVATYTSGNDSITIKRAGHFYFLCGFPGHCQAGQKVDIRVVKTSGPSLSPSADPYASSPSESTYYGMVPAPSQNSGSSLQSAMAAGKLGFSMLALLAFSVAGFAF